MICFDFSQTVNTTTQKKIDLDLNTPSTNKKSPRGIRPRCCSPSSRDIKHPDKVNIVIDTITMGICVLLVVLIGQKGMGLCPHCDQQQAALPLKKREPNYTVYMYRWGSPSDHSCKRPVLVTASIVKPHLNLHLNSVMKSSHKRPLAQATQIPLLWITFWLLSKHFNPLQPSVNISILLTCCHTFVVVLVGRSCSNIKRVHPRWSFP